MGRERGRKGEGRERPRERLRGRDPNRSCGTFGNVIAYFLITLRTIYYSHIPSLT